MADTSQLPPHLSCIMERLRARATQYKPWPDLIKLTKTALVDKRSVVQLDANERLQVDKCLDTLQKSIEVKGVKSMMERLESISKQLGLKTTCPTGTDMFISSDMFYVEVVLDMTGFVAEVKIAHQSDPLPCQELTNCLRAGDFTEFTRHLEGLASIYQLNADSKAKTKAYLALHSLEYDLTTLSQCQSDISRHVNNLVHKTPVGILEPRRGGHPLKLTFFVSPYDLIDRKSKTSLPLTIETIVSKKLGYSATVSIESSPNKSHKLQTQSLISRSNDPKQLPVFGAFSNLNSSILPAVFVLKLDTSMPISIENAAKISSVTNIEFMDNSIKPQSLIKIIAGQVLPEKDRAKVTSEEGDFKDRSFYAKLPDQQHNFFIHQKDCPHLMGISISSIPFNHPTHVPQILDVLRHQVMFNVVIGSTIRKLTKFADANPCHSFEVTCPRLTNLSVAFEHPLEESLASLEVDLSDVTSVKCRLYESSSFEGLVTDDYATKILQRSLSLPVTLRMILMKAKESHQKMMSAHVVKTDSGPSQVTSDAHPSASSQSTDPFLVQTSSVSNLASNQRAPTTDEGQSVVDQMRAQLFQSMSNMSNLTPAQRIALATIQSQFQQQRMMVGGAIPFPVQSARGQQPTQNQMLLNMLRDSPAATASSANAMNLVQLLAAQQQQEFLMAQKGQKKPRKRKNTDPGGSAPHVAAAAAAMATGKSPKRKFSEDESIGRQGHDQVQSMDAFGESMIAGSHGHRSFFPSGQDPSSLLASSSSMVHFLQRSLSQPTTSASEYEFQPGTSATTSGRGRKRTSSRVRSSEEPASLLDPDEPFAFDTSADQLRSSSVGPTTKKPRADSGQVRRSSAGVMESLDLKDKKRRRSESVDSQKSGQSTPSPSSSGLMLPPATSTTPTSDLPSVVSSPSNVRPELKGPRIISPHQVTSTGKVGQKLTKDGLPAAKPGPKPKIVTSGAMSAALSLTTGSKVKTTGFKLKTPQVSSSSGQGRVAPGQVTSPPVSSSSPGPGFPTGMEATLSIVTPTSVSSTKPSTQTSPPFKKKGLGSLSAVIDKLSQKTTVGGQPLTEEPGPSDAMTEVKAEPSASPSGSRPDSSSKVPGPSTKPTASKVSPGQATFAVASRPTGLKMTISKKPTSSTEGKSGLKPKVSPGPGLVRPSSSTSGSSLMASKVKPGQGLIKKVGQAKQGSVSSSSSLLTPKSGRPMASGKVSSTGLESAIPQFPRLDKLPKIPKTERASSGQVGPSVAHQQPQPSISSTPSFYRRKSTQGPQAGQGPTPQPPPPNPDHRMAQATSSEPPEGGPNQRFQSNTITSTEVPPARTEFYGPSVSSSSGLSSEGISFASTYTSATGVSATIVSSGPSADVGSTSTPQPPFTGPTPRPPTPKKVAGVTSSSDTPSSPPVESTPSSPVEAVAVVAAPLIIPTESSFDEDTSNRAIDSTNPSVKDGQGVCSSSGQVEQKDEEDEDDEDGLIIDVDYGTGSAPTPHEGPSSDGVSSSANKSNVTSDHPSGPASPSPAADEGPASPEGPKSPDDEADAGVGVSSSEPQELADDAAIDLSVSEGQTAKSEAVPSSSGHLDQSHLGDDEPMDDTSDPS